MATQYFKRNLFLNLYREGKNTASLFPPAAWEKNVWHLQPIPSIWRPLAFLAVTLPKGFPGSASGKEPSSQCRRFKRCGFLDLPGAWVGKVSWRRAWQPTPWVFSPGASHGQRSLWPIGSQKVRHNWSNLACTRMIGKGVTKAYSGPVFRKQTASS